MYGFIEVLNSVDEDDDYDDAQGFGMIDHFLFIHLLLP